MASDINFPASDTYFRLTRLGMTPIGAREVLLGQPVSNQNDRLRVAEIISRLSRLFSYQLDLLVENTRK